MQTHGYGGPAVKLCVYFLLWGIGTPNPHVVWWCGSDTKDLLWALPAIWAFLPTGSDICLLCGLLVSIEWHLGISVNWVLISNYHWGLFVLGNVCLGLCTSHPRRGSVTDLSFCVWVCIPLVWLLFLLPYVKWEIQVLFIKKNFSCKMTKEKERWLIFRQCMVTLFLRLWRRLVKIQLKNTKTGSFCICS